LDSLAPTDDLQIAFGDVSQMTEVNRLITVSNEGTENLVVGEIAAANSLLPPFYIVTDECSTTVLMPGESCEFSVQIEPSALGSFSETFDIPSNDPDEPYTNFSVQGNSVAHIPRAVISVSDSVAPYDDLILDFGEINEMETSSEELTVSNLGDARLLIGDIAQLDQLDLPFQIVNDACSNVELMPAQSCEIEVQFSVGSGSADYLDSFDIPSSDVQNAALSIAVRGKAVVNPADDPSDDDGEASGSSDGGGSSSGGGGVGWVLLMLLTVRLWIRSFLYAIDRRADNS